MPATEPAPQRCLCVDLQGIIRSFRQAAQLAVSRVRELAVDIGGKDLEERKQLLEKCAQTSLNSKLVRGASRQGSVQSGVGASRSLCCVPAGSSHDANPCAKSCCELR